MRRLGAEHEESRKQKAFRIIEWKEKEKRNQKTEEFGRIHSKLLTVVASWGITIVGNTSAGK